MMMNSILKLMLFSMCCAATAQAVEVFWKPISGTSWSGADFKTISAAQAAEVSKLQPNHTAAQMPVQSFNFANCGYRQGAEPIPFIPAVITVNPVDGDDTDLIQQAIDTVSARAPDANGFRGAVLLAEGEFQVSRHLKIDTSGVVLRGSGDEGTTILADGIDRRTLVRVEGAEPEEGSSYAVASSELQAGDTQIELNNAAGLSVGDTVFIDRPASMPWIESLGMNSYSGGFSSKMINWQEDSRVVRWDRTITNITGNVITFDNPVTTEMSAAMQTQPTVTAYTWEGRVEQVGLENIRFVSNPDTATNPKDEEHAWICIQFWNVKDSWIRNVTAEKFVSSAVWFDHTVSQCTVEHTRFLDPISEIGGRRRISFRNGGQLNLFENCFARNGRHDFVAGFCSAGPNVFRDCTTENSLAFSGSFESWACGALFDNVKIDNNALSFANIEHYADGMGWTGSHSTFWNCEATEIDADMPPGSRNYIYGATGATPGDVEVFGTNGVYAPQSLYGFQVTATSNALERARFVFPTENPTAFVFNPALVPVEEKKPVQPVEIVNGRFVCNGEIFWDGHARNDIWNDRMYNTRVDLNPYRWVPGYEGPGYTEDLDEATDRVLAKPGRKLYGYTPPLWYDRRRMAHDIVIRENPEVVAPFYEMPWSRSGTGTCFDQLSQYDLERFNPWYFKRVDQTAKLCDEKGLLFYNEIYDNHWLIEAGAHWPDLAWRPTNSVQNTGMIDEFPWHYNESGSVRISIADEFYNVTNNVENRRLHTLYINQCLDALKDRSNVLHAVAFQDVAPLEFQTFYFDLVRAWEAMNGIDLKLAFKSAKNTTDAFMAMPEYAEMIDVLDIRYWHRIACTAGDMSEGDLWAPDGGKNRAYREYWKQTFGDKPPPTKPQYLYEQVREYRDRFPDKAIIACERGAGVLPIVMAGGAYALFHDEMVNSKPDEDARAVIKFTNTPPLSTDLFLMGPNDAIVSNSMTNWCLADAVNQSYLIYSSLGDAFDVTLPAGDYTAQWHTPTGVEQGGSVEINSDGSAETLTPTNGTPALVYITAVE